MTTARVLGAVHGLTLRTSTPARLARAAVVEGMLCALADGLDAMIAQIETHEADPVPAMREQYAAARENILDRAG